jgi:hypothetical protein
LAIEKMEELSNEEEITKKNNEEIESMIGKNKIHTQKRKH